MDGITIYDIAREAGVSPSTVSRVINDYQYVKSSTKEKVLKILKENNYVPNDTARSLVNRSTRMVGILIADIRTSHHTAGVYYVEQEFYKKGYSCIIYNTGGAPEDVVPYIYQLSQKKIDALVMIGSVYQNEAVAEAVRNYLPSTPIAICNGFIDLDNVYGVVSDEKSGVRDSVKLLSGRGCRNAAFIYDRISPSTEDKIDGFLEGCSLYMKSGKAIVLDGGLTIETQSETTEKLIRENPDIDAIIYSEDFIAAIGVHTLYEMKKRVPEDISVIGINDSDLARIMNPSLTSLDNMLYDTCLMAARNIMLVLSGEAVAHKIMLETRITERNSTRK